MQLHKISVRLSSAAFLLLVAAAPVAAADPSMPANEAAAESPDSAPAHSTRQEASEPKKICRNIETTSSRLKSQRVCLTREEWRRAKYN